MTELGWICGPAPQDEYTISIITVIRRDFEALERTLQSLGDLDRRAEVIVIEGDDAYWPESARIRSEFAGKWHSLRWLLEPDRGIYSAMNKGIMAARGSWIWFLNAGDHLAADGTVADILSMVDELDHNIDWVIGSANVRGRNGRIVRLKKAEDFTRGSLFSGNYTPCHQAVLTRREALARFGGFDETLQIAADYRLFLQLGRSSLPPAICPDFLIDYLEGGLSESARSRRIMEYAHARRAELSRSRTEYGRDITRSLLRAVRHSALWRNSSSRGSGDNHDDG